MNVEEIIGVLIGIIIVLIGVLIIYQYEKKGYLKWSNWDPYSSESTLLDNSNDEPREWRMKKLQEVAQKPNTDEKIINGVVGEFGEGMYLCVKKALELGFKVNIISGDSVYPERKEDLSKLIDEYPKSFNYFIINKYRPRHHFIFIGRDNIFIEVPHEVNQKNKDSIGLNGAKPEIIQRLSKEYSKYYDRAQKANKSDISKLNVINV